MKKVMPVVVRTRLAKMAKKSLTQRQLCRRESPPVPVVAVEER